MHWLPTQQREHRCRSSRAFIPSAALSNQGRRFAILRNGKELEVWQTRAFKDILHFRSKVYLTRSALISIMMK